MSKLRIEQLEIGNRRQTGRFHQPAFGFSLLGDQTVKRRAITSSLSDETGILPWTVILKPATTWAFQTPPYWPATNRTQIGKGSEGLSNGDSGLRTASAMTAAGNKTGMSGLFSRNIRRALVFVAGSRRATKPNPMTDRLSYSAATWSTRRTKDHGTMVDWPQDFTVCAHRPALSGSDHCSTTLQTSPFTTRWSRLCLKRGAHSQTPDSWSKCFPSERSVVDCRPDPRREALSPTWRSREVAGRALRSSGSPNGRWMAAKSVPPPPTVHTKPSGRRTRVAE